MRVLFLRTFKRLNGGDLKMWHYFNHFLELGHDPVVRFSKGSRLDESNPWSTADPHRVLSADERVEADLLFLGGTDWSRLTPAEQKRPPAPVINLVQHVRHASRHHPELRAFLANPATRICVSREVEDAIRRTGLPNGRIVTIANGTDLRARRVDQADRDIDVLILAGKPRATPPAGLSIPEVTPRTLGRMVARLVPRRHRSVELVTKLLPRHEFLDLLARARVSVLVPHVTEGFYLPALEAMALGTIVVCPDCVGNRSFCLDRQTAFVTRRNPVSMARAVERALLLSEEDRNAMREAGWRQVEAHSLEREREGLRTPLDELGLS
jgi:glycosyltransferase involved in cell wall biosynthesis